MTLVLMYIVFFALLAGLILYFLILFKNLPQKKKRSSLDKTMIRNKWAEIEGLSRSGNISGINSAVMDADKLFDHVLKCLTGITQGTMADRLKASKERFSDYSIYQDVWEAHKVRNRLAHEINSEVLSLESKKALDKFKKGLKDLKVL